MIDEDLLVHSAVIYIPLGYDGDRQAIYEEIQLEKVRISHSKGVSISNLGVVPSDSMTLWFDCTLSLPSDFIPADGHILEYDGKKYTVKNVKTSYADSNVVQFYKADLV